MYPEIEFMCSPYLLECTHLIHDLGLVLVDSPQGLAISRYGSKFRFCELYQRAKAKEKKDFQERFHQRFKKFARVDHSESQIDCCNFSGLFEDVHISD